ncbi:MAG: 2-oxoacid:acceptor oxidoreductase subunit alpha [Xanthomonadales bacterium]|nr:2-oxoacid:acceptor oxidoreductase subunit alpha [Xanthomonadales bacterium]
MPDTHSRANDFVLKIATVNGTGSASANGLLMKAIFRSGVPVSGKNLFPSNIQGMPTWYEIRANGQGWCGRSERVDLMVAMNAQTYQKDLALVSPGGYLLYDSTWPRDKSMHRDDITTVGIPFAQLVNEHFANARIRILMKNIAYVGAVCAFLNINLDIVKTLLEEIFASKPKLVGGNLEAINLGYNYVREHFAYPLEFRIEASEKLGNSIIVDGNTAAGLGCVYAGATVGAWYPITPSTGVMDSFKTFCQQFRTSEDGKNRYIIIQAEDELAAAGMAISANWAGARAFTPTSGPGISLMSEFIGLAYYAEIPCVFINVQRTGPSTGMPTRTQQCDLMLCAFASHGDTRHPFLLPKDPNECFHMAIQSFDLSERLQTPVFMLSDLDIGMNDWMVDEISFDDNYIPDRGKVLSDEDLEKVESFYRFDDVDGDGIPYRTYPGSSKKGVYFVRGSGHNRFGGYTEDSDEYQEVVDRLLVKWDTAKTLMPAPELQKANKNTRIGIIAYGSTDLSAREAIALLAEEGIAIDYLRLRAFPFNQDLTEFLDNHDSVMVVEQNRDGQMRSLIELETSVNPGKLSSVLYYAGMPISADSIYKGVLKQLNRESLA